MPSIELNLLWNCHMFAYTDELRFHTAKEQAYFFQCADMPFCLCKDLLVGWYSYIYQPKIVCDVSWLISESALFSEMLKAASVSAMIKVGNEPVVWYVFSQGDSSINSRVIVVSFVFLNMGEYQLFVGLFGDGQKYEMGGEIVFQCFCVLSQTFCVPQRNFKFARKSIEIYSHVVYSHLILFPSQKVCEWIQSFLGEHKSFVRECKVSRGNARVL